MTDFRRVARVFSRPIERQLTESDCAVWAIKAMCFQLEVSVPPANLVRDHIDLDNVGTSIRGVRDALNEFGVSAMPVQGPNDAISKAPLPAIAMVNIGPLNSHYVVILQADQRSVKYLDPAMGGAPLTMGADEFAGIFSGNLILCERKAGHVAVDLGKEIEPGKFIFDAVVHESNAALAMAIGEIFQLLMLLIGVLMLKNFFSSAVAGLPNFWFLAGISLCALIYVWMGKQIEMVRADIKSRAMLSLFGFVTNLIQSNEVDRKKGLREMSDRCVKGISAVASSLTHNACLPGNTLSLILFIALVAWFDFYAAGYAIGVAVLLPIAWLWIGRRIRIARQKVSRSRNLNQVSMVYLMSEEGRHKDIVSDMPWSQLEYCETVSRHDRWISAESTLGAAVARINAFAGLMIGGLQTTTLGMGHTITLFFLLSIYTSVLFRWAKQIAAVPESRHQVRVLLDFLSDLTSSLSDAPESSQRERIGSAVLDVRGVA